MNPENQPVWPLPDPLDVHLGSPRVARNPFPYYEALLRHGPVHFLPRHGFWIVLGYDEVRQALKAHQDYSNLPYSYVGPVMVGTDPPTHTASRAASSSFFTPGALEGMRALLEASAADLIKPEFDAVHGYAIPLALASALALIGFTSEAASAVLAMDARMRVGQASLDEMIAILDGMAPDARLYHELLAAAGHGVTGDEARKLIRLFWLAGTATTERLLVNAILCLLKHDGLRPDRLDGDGLAAFIEEVARLYPVELLLPRVTKSVTTLGGAELPRGAEVQVCVGAANRDPQVFEAPSDFKPNRKPNLHLSFGHGVHHCIGAPLGRQTLFAALRVLLQAAPDFRSGEPLDTIPYRATMHNITPTRLIIRT